MRRARERLELFPATFLGIDVDVLLATVNRTLETVNASDKLEKVDFSRIEIPQITSLPSQSESG